MEHDRDDAPWLVAEARRIIQYCVEIDDPLSHMAGYLLMILADAVHDTKGKWWGSMPKLAKEHGIRRNTAYGAIRELEARGIIVCYERHPNTHGRKFQLMPWLYGYGEAEILPSKPTTKPKRYPSIASDESLPGNTPRYAGDNAACYDPVTRSDTHNTQENSLSNTPLTRGNNKRCRISDLADPDVDIEERRATANALLANLRGEDS